MDENYLSNSMEMYLVTIARLREGNQPVPLSQLADALSVTTVSVNEMCRKLQDNGLLIYRPYKGALLTEPGEKLATHTLRRHRIWEVFLVDKLGFDYPTAHTIACQLEHATNEKVIDSLEAHLGFPVVNPIGYPIPILNRKITGNHIVSLVNIPVGRSAMIKYCDMSEVEMEFLKGIGVQSQEKTNILASGKDNLLIQIKDSKISLSRNLAERIFVEIHDDKDKTSQLDETEDENNYDDQNEEKK